MTKKGQLPVIDEANLPKLYSVWLQDILPGPIPMESNATCDSCVMLPAEGDPATPTRRLFHPETKCCTFVPNIPNFSVGGVLAHQSDENLIGYESTVARIHTRIGLTPLGLDAPPSVKMLYAATPGAFGQSTKFRCPHYDVDKGGRCGIHQFRNGVCATWHCKHVRGKVGRTFWHDLRAFLSATEEELAIWCARRLGIPPRAIQHLLARSRNDLALELEGELANRVTGLSGSHLWGEWVGREVDYFRACYGLVSETKWATISSELGPSIQSLHDVLLESYHELVVPRIPERLTAGMIGYSTHNATHLRIKTYSAYDELLLEGELVPFLSSFDGSPVTEAIEHLSQQGVSLDAALIQRLFDFDVLIDPMGASSNARS